jgi:Asp-tRNA(Asn)/Glu-tRNA(Gln) amidotransferase A subunit family amidase
MSNEILRMTAVELLQQYRDKTLSPVEVAEAMLVQIERLDSHTNGFCLVDRETSLGLARESEQRYQKGEAQGLVDGVPVAVKDVFLTPMWPTIKGSYTVDPKSTLNKSAPATAALARHGYVPIGKTTTPEFGWKGVTDNPVEQSLESKIVGRWFERWQRCCCCAGYGTVGFGHGCRWIYPYPGRVLRHSRTQALLWRSTPLAG